MDKSLVIVESMAKARTINEYLGNKYIVKSSLGHVRDLPKSGNFRLQKNINVFNKVENAKKDEYNVPINQMGIDPYNDWKANYQILPSKEKVVAELRSLASKVEHIYLATDLDREGEAIAWHLQEVIGGDNQRFSRIIFNEITKNAIKKAFANPCQLNINRVNAQQARRFLDRVVGYMLSSLLWKKIAHGLSAGRVQSTAVRLIVEQERKIKTFIPKKYWKIHAELLTANKELIKMEVTHKAGKSFKPMSKVQVNAALKSLNNANYQIFSRKNKLIISKPNPPFITSTLQQAASIYLGFSVKKTMMIAQMLYETGYITYIRTDSTNLSEDALTMVYHYIKHKFGDKYLPKHTNIYSNRKSSQEAHEAIRPSNIEINVNSLTGVENDAKKLYQLIWQQFIACQMTPSEFDLTTLIVKAGNFELITKRRILRFDGWRIVIPTTLHQDDKEKISSTIKVNDQLKLKTLSSNKHFTRSPMRFNEASLIKELEKRGIGRPSTYSTIISTIQDRGYVKIKNHRFYAEKIGEIVTDRLNEHFSELMNYSFTAKMENKLDLIAENRIEWKRVLDEFFTTFIKQFKNANKSPEDGGMQLNKIVLTSIKCPNCNRKMGIRTTSSGVFLSCSGYTLTVECCKKIINLIPEDEISNLIIKEKEDIETSALLARRRCFKCNIAMDSYFIDYKYKLYVCGNNPVCNGYEIKKSKFNIKDYNLPITKCSKCGLEMHLKIGRFGKYMRCINDVCKNTCKILKDGEFLIPKEDPIPLPELVCKKSNAYFVLRNGTSGIFLAANTFPKSKETRAPLVEELVRFKDRLPIKFNHLISAPLVDSEGNKTIVRFNHKTKQQYICSEKNGKRTDWSAFYIDGKWVEKSK